MSRNQLSGEIPTELKDLANLRHLHLSDNDLTGDIPPELGSLSNLTQLYLSRNQLSGEIPAGTGQPIQLGATVSDQESVDRRDTERTEQP